MIADLQRQLDAIVGPFAVAGYPAAGKITLETLSDNDIGFGQLDGMVHSAGDDGPQGHRHDAGPRRPMAAGAIGR